jgi:uncharacterized protein YbjT (DUF2867 family)
MILVVGGTGELGGRAVRLLREHGHQLRRLVRPETDNATLDQLGATVVRGDLTDPPSLSPACHGIDTVVATVTAMGRRLGGAHHASIRQVDQAGMSALIDAAEQARVGRFVLSPPLAWIQREVRRSSAPRSPTSGGCEHRRCRRYSCDPTLSKKPT